MLSKPAATSHYQIEPRAARTARATGYCAYRAIGDVVEGYGERQLSHARSTYCE
jgi:hypothetical protein